MSEVNITAARYLVELTQKGSTTHRVRQHERNTGGQVIEETTTSAADYLRQVTLKLKASHPDLPKRYDASVVGELFVLTQASGKKFYAGTLRDRHLFTFESRLAATFSSGEAAHNKGVLAAAGHVVDILPAPTNPNRSSL